MISTVSDAAMIAREATIIQLHKDCTDIKASMPCRRTYLHLCLDVQAEKARAGEATIPIMASLHLFQEVPAGWYPPPSCFRTQLARR